MALTAELLCTPPILEDTSSYQTLATSQEPLETGVCAGRLKFCSLHLTKASIMSAVGSQHDGWRETGSSWADALIHTHFPSPGSHLSSFSVIVGIPPHLD